MRGARVVTALLLILGLCTSAFAGDLQQSIARAATQATQATQPSPAAPDNQQAGHPKIDHRFLWPGTVLFVGGMSMAVYGFLHTKGGSFVQGGVSTESNTQLGGAGLAVAGLGGALLFIGSQKAKNAAVVTVGPGQLGVAHRITW